MSICLNINHLSATKKMHLKMLFAEVSVGRCVIPWEFLGKSVKHTFSCREMYPV